jgi:hypothetical protein
LGNSAGGPSSRQHGDMGSELPDRSGNTQKDSIRSSVWPDNCDRQRMSQRYLVCSVAVLLLVSFVLFLWYVPILPLFAAIVIVPVLILMFGLGVHVGSMIGHAKPAAGPRQSAKWNPANVGVDFTEPEVSDPLPPMRGRGVEHRWQ